MGTTEEGASTELGQELDAPRLTRLVRVGSLNLRTFRSGVYRSSGQGAIASAAAERGTARTGLGLEPAMQSESSQSGVSDRFGVSRIQACIVIHSSCTEIPGKLTEDDWRQVVAAACSGARPLPSDFCRPRAAGARRSPRADGQGVSTGRRGCRDGVRERDDVVAVPRRTPGAGCTRFFSRPRPGRSHRLGPGRTGLPPRVPARGQECVSIG
jgi:hypothetical protein